jgi:hypothetical protein
MPTNRLAAAQKGLVLDREDRESARTREAG